ncbi:MAG: TatD family hydrolase [Armatimonadota bacterium]|nr:TatD family hydrolase [bacterium]MDW8320894.1 TatD family hydrolase [Armatimonadota bacterium]
MNIWTDTHCHLNHPDFAHDAQQVWSRAQEAGVHQAIVVGYDLASSEAAIQIATAYDGCWASVGVHPHDAAQCTQDALSLLQQRALQPQVAAIGEIGLDYYRNLSPKNVQQQAFERQIQIASQLNLPVIIHCRNAYDDLLDILSRHPLPGVLHCFSGELHHARRAVEMGWYLGIGGVATFKNAHSLREVVQQTPLERLLLETDAPYLAPVPHRGKRNEPSYIPLIAEVVASLKNIPIEEVARITTQNARCLFRLEK